MNTLWIESTFVTFDGVELFYRAKKPAKHSTQAVLVLHRGHEHSGRVISLIEELNMSEQWHFAFDLRGHGQSPGERGYAENFETWVKDLNAFASHITNEYSIKTENMFVVANSVGSVMAAAWVHDYSPGIRGMALAAPAFLINLYVPLALPALKLLSKFTRKAFVTSYVRSNLLTRDPIEAKAYDSDALITKRISVSVLTSLFDLSKRIVNDAAAIETPTLIISAGSDFVVKNKVQEEFFNRISSTKKEYIHLKGYRHALFHEKDRGLITDKVREFANKCFEPKALNLPAIITPARPHTVDELQYLIQKATPAKALYYAIFRYLLSTLGKNSRGVALGLKKGFDSGASLDYVYQNIPGGKNYFGKIIDRIYLSSIGWRGVRIRKNNLKVALIQALSLLQSKGEKPVVLDMAAGRGRYLFEAAESVHFPVALHLRDIFKDNLDAAKKISLEKNIYNTTFTVADAFNPESILSASVKPNIIVISGIFELFENNYMIHNCLKACAQILRPGGYLLYTGQPWHPQMEMIARVLNSHRGGRWVMRRRVQAEMDELVKNAGLNKLETAVDNYGIFTVSVSKKPDVINVTECKFTKEYDLSNQFEPNTMS